MKLFRSQFFQWFIGIAFAVSVFISFATPISGSFKDVSLLSMAGVSQVTPVLVSFKLLNEGKIEARDFTGATRQIEIPQSFSVRHEESFVGDFSYRASDSTYILNKVVRVEPIMTFPLIQGLGELGRNILFHVPMSFVAFVVFLIATIYSILFLRKKDMKYDLEARAYSALGLLLTILATVTGSIWAKFSWGSFWNFDPRESSILILLFIYIAYFLLRQLMEDSEEKVARIAAVYNIIAFVTVPFLMFVLPRITQSLHPGGGDSVAPVINLSGKSYLDPTLKIVMWTNVTLFLLLSIWMKDLYVRITSLKHRND